MSSRPATDMTPTIGDVGGRSVVLAYGSVAAEYEALQTRAACSTAAIGDDFA